MTETVKAKTRTEVLLEALREGRPLGGRDEFELVLRLAVPGLLAQISVVLMHYIDAAMVGHLGAQGSAAVGLVSTTVWLFWGISGSVIAGFSVQAAHRIGAREFDAARDLFRQAAFSVVLFASVMASVGWLIHRELPFWLGADASIAEDASDYFVILVGFLPIVLMNWTAGSFLRASGDMKTPSFLGVLMCVLDVFFNTVLIFPTRSYDFLGITWWIPGAGLGVAGAAWATFIAQTICASIMLWVLVFRSPILRLAGTRGPFIPTATVLRRAATIALPMGCERVLMGGAQIVSTMIIAPLGVVSIAAHTLAITCESLCYMPGYGICEAATTLVGQSIGAKRAALARSLAWKCLGSGMAVMTVMGATLWIAAPALMALMTEVPEVIELGSQILRIEAWAEPMFAAAIVCHGVFVGAGDTLVPAIMNLASFWGLRLTAAWLMAPVWGLKGVWIAMCAELIVRGSIFLLRLRSGAWLRRSAKLSA